MFLGLAVEVALGRADDPPEETERRRKLLHTRLEGLLEPAPVDFVPDEQTLLEWLRIRANELRVRGRTQEADRLHHTMSLLKVAVDAAALQSANPQSDK